MNSKGDGRMKVRIGEREYTMNSRVSHVVKLYIDIKRLEKKIEMKERELHKYLLLLSDEEFDSYTALTTIVDIYNIVRTGDLAKRIEDINKFSNLKDKGDIDEGH